MVINMENLQENDDLRYERKFVIDSYNKGYIFEYLKSQAFISEIYKKRVINSLYFDTPGLLFALQNINGDKSRIKIRQRFYDDFLIEKPSLIEIKYKNGLVGGKFKKNIENSNFNTFQKFIKSYYMDYNFSYLPCEYFLDLIPTIFISYERNYFISKLNNCRLTFDNNIKYFPIDSTIKNFPINRNIFFDDQNAIIELKYSAENEIEAGFLMKNINLRITRNSKYINGLKFINLI